MKIKIVVVGLAVVLAAMAGFSSAPTTAQAQGNVTCTIGGFEATIFQGPNKGLTVVGELTLEATADGSISGTLKQKTGDPIKVVGQVHGRLIGLALNMGKTKDGKLDRYVYGTGLMLNGIKDCAGAPIGGSLVGPDLGDSGEWGCRPGCPPGCCRSGVEGS